MKTQSLNRDREISRKEDKGKMEEKGKGRVGRERTMSSGTLEEWAKRKWESGERMIGKKVEENVFKKNNNTLRSRKENRGVDLGEDANTREELRELKKEIDINIGIGLNTKMK